MPTRSFRFVILLYHTLVHHPLGNEVQTFYEYEVRVLVPGTYVERTSTEYIK